MTSLRLSARFNRPLTALYGALGVQLFPRWDLRAYDVRQLGASADGEGAGMITVRASIKNGAPQPQPLPLLRVTLQDRFGNRIAARDVQPEGLPARRDARRPRSCPPASASMRRWASRTRAPMRSDSRSTPACRRAAAASPAPTTRPCAERAP